MVSWHSTVMLLTALVSVFLIVTTHAQNPGAGGGMGGAGQSLTLNLNSLRIQCMQFMMLEIPVSNLCKQLLYNPMAAMYGVPGLMVSLLTAPGENEEAAGAGFGGGFGGFGGGMGGLMGFGRMGGGAFGAAFEA